MGGLDMSCAAAITDPPTGSRTNTARTDLANLFIVDPPKVTDGLLRSFDGIRSGGRSQRMSVSPGFGLSRTELYAFPARMGVGGWPILDGWGPTPPKNLELDGRF